MTTDTASSDSLPTSPAEFPSPDMVRPATAATAAAPSETKFDEEKAIGFLRNGDWVELEDYLLSFLSSSHQDGEYFHPHPGFFFIVYEGQLLDMIEAQDFEAAHALFTDKVEPLLVHDGYNLYRPLDLEDRIEKLRNCVKKRMLPPKGEQVAVREVIQVAILDYIYLYFPETIRLQGEEKAKSLLAFAVVVKEFKNSNQQQNADTQCFRCLACQWVVPVSQSIYSLRDHIKHIGDHQFCPRVTLYMRRRLNEIEGVDETIDMEKLASNYLRKSKKRKVAQSSSGSFKKEVQAVVDFNISLDSALLSIVKGLANTTLSILQLLTTFTDPTASKVREINRQAGTLIIQLKSACFEAMASLSLAMDARYVFGSVESLQTVSGLWFPFIPLVPDAVRKLVLEQEKLISELRLHCMTAAAQRAGIASDMDSDSEQSSVFSSTRPCVQRG